MKSVYKISMDESQTMWVHGVSHAYMCVQSTDKENAKVFKTMKSAQTFLDKNSDCGYGLTSKTAKIVEIA